MIAWKQQKNGRMETPVEVYAVIYEDEREIKRARVF